MTGVRANARPMEVVNAQVNKKKRVTDPIIAFSLINKDLYTKNGEKGFKFLALKGIKFNDL